MPAVGRRGYDEAAPNEERRGSHFVTSSRTLQGPSRVTDACTLHSSQLDEGSVRTRLERMEASRSIRPSVTHRGRNQGPPNGEAVTMVGVTPMARAP